MQLGTVQYLVEQGACTVCATVWVLWCSTLQNMQLTAWDDIGQCSWLHHSESEVYFSSMTAYPVKRISSPVLAATPLHGLPDVR